MQITKNADTSKYNYKGYGICFDEGGVFSEGSINNVRNALVFGVHENSVIHSNNRKNNVYVMESTTRHCMQTKYTVKILRNQTKSSY